MMELLLTALLLMVSQSTGELSSLVRVLELAHKNTFEHDMAICKACVRFSQTK
jgi:hypothetical protein